MRIKLPPITRGLILLVIAHVISTSASAADISGKVTEVIDGNTINLKSLSHTIKVQLVAVAPPEKSQPYAAAARQHLSDLILGKYVVVRYTSIGEQGYLVGKVLLEKSDVGAQMLRDGVGWYVQVDADNLAEADRQLYQECEKAARSERRGLWQDQSTISPWDFRKAQLSTPTISTPAAPRSQLQPRVLTPKRAGLTSEDMMGGVLQPGSNAGKPDIKQISPGSAPGTWVRFQPADRHFSILAPSDSVEVVIPVLDNLGKLSQIHYISGSKDGTFYSLIWSKGPNNNSTAATVADSMVKGLVGGINLSLEKAALGFVVTAQPGRELSLTGFTGRQYRLSGGNASGVVRVFSKQTGEEREVFALLVLDRGESAGAEFLASFKVNQGQ